MSEAMTQVELTKPIVDKDIQLIKGFFPENATVEKDNSGTYLVEATLEDHVICEGGQKISLSFNLENILTESAVSDNGEIVEPYAELLINKLVVNGKDIKIDGIDLYMSNANKNQIIQGDSLHDCNLFNLNKDGAGVYLEESIIVLRSFNNGLHLATYFHELGHLIREEEDLNEQDKNMSNGINRGVIKKLILMEDKFDEDKLSPEEVESCRMIIYEEKRASIKALSLLGRSKELFPNDLDLSKLKKTFSYILMNNLHIRRSISPSEVESVVDFDQDWHY